MFKKIKENINLMLSTELPAAKGFVITGFLENEINKLENKVVLEIQTKESENNELKQEIKRLNAELQLKQKKESLLQEKE